MVAHPEGHVGEDGRREQVGAGLKDGLPPGAVIAADRVVDDDSACGGQYERCADASEDVSETVTPPDAVQVRQEDRHDYARLDSLAQEDDERGKHVSGLPLRVRLAIP